MIKRCRGCKQSRHHRRRRNRRSLERMLRNKNAVKWKKTKEHIRRIANNGKYSTSEESEQLNGWDDHWNGTADACKFSRHFDVTSSGTYEDTLGMTRRSRKTLGRQAEGFQDWEQNHKNRRREAMWHNAQHAWRTAGKAGDMGESLIFSYCFRRCQHVPKDDFTWFYVPEGTADEKANARMTGMWCANCGQQHSEHECGCVTTMQDIHADVNDCLVLLATLLADGVVSATINVVTPANHVHHEQQKQVFEELPTNSQEGFAKAWTSFLAAHR